MNEVELKTEIERLDAGVRWTDYSITLFLPRSLWTTAEAEIAETELARCGRKLKVIRETGMCL